MSSSQGLNSQAVDGSVNRAAFLASQSIRDSSDWTRFKKEVRVYSSNATEVDVPSVSPWLPYGNDFRLTFLNGQFKRRGKTPAVTPCTTCGGPDFNTANGVPLD